MIKRLVLSVIVMFSLSCSAQLSFSFGVGLKDTMDFAGQVKFNYQMKRIGFSTGMIFTRPGTGAVLFNTEMFVPIKFDDYSRAWIHGGYLYRMESADNKQLNGHEWMLGGTVEWSIGRMLNLYIDGSYTERRSIIFMLGMRASFPTKEICY